MSFTVDLLRCVLFLQLFTIYIVSIVDEQFKNHLLGELDKYFGLPIEEQVKMLLISLEMSHEEVEKKEEIISKMEFWLSVSFPNCRLLPFGSSVSGLSALNSDLDLYFCPLDGCKILPFYY